MPDPAPADRLLTLRQVAERLNVSVRYVRTLRQSGALPVVLMRPRCIRVRPEDLDRLVVERMAGRRPQRARPHLPSVRPPAGWRGVRPPEFRRMERLARSRRPIAWSGAPQLPDHLAHAVEETEQRLHGRDGDPSALRNS